MTIFSAWALRQGLTGRRSPAIYWHLDGINPAVADAVAKLLLVQTSALETAATKLWEGRKEGSKKPADICTL